MLIVLRPIKWTWVKIELSLSHSPSRLLFLIPTVITKVPLDKDAYQQIVEVYGKNLLNPWSYIFMLN